MKTNKTLGLAVTLMLALWMIGAAGAEVGFTCAILTDLDRAGRACIAVTIGARGLGIDRGAP